MNGEFNKKEILKQMEENRKNARKLVEDSIKDAKKILEQRKLLGYESSPLAVVRLAEALFKIEFSTVQGKAKVEQAEQMIKARAEAAKKESSCENCQERRSDVATPVA